MAPMAKRETFHLRQPEQDSFNKPRSLLQICRLENLWNHEMEGFGNPRKESMNLSVLITAHNEPFDEVQATVKSIRDTAPGVEIIVVDDASQIPLSLEDKQAKLVRNEDRAGVGGSRHIAATHATQDFILITDAHVRFEPGWFDVAMKRITDRPHTLHCGSCIALSPSQMDISKAKTVYSGASLNIYGADKNKHGVNQIMEGVWLKESVDDQPLSCIMGAVYFTPTDWFFHIGGLRLLKGWGADEPMLAIKTWLAGGEVRLLKNVRIGHQFREASCYRTEHWKLIFNVMQLAITCMNEKQAQVICNLFNGGSELLEAKNRIREDANIILSEKHYLQSIFVRDFQWYVDKFGLTFPS